MVSHPARPDEDVPSQNGTMALEEGDIAMGHDPFLEHEQCSMILGMRIYPSYIGDLIVIQYIGDDSNTAHMSLSIEILIR